MDERAINGAAIEAISDLQLDCEIKDVSRSPGGDEWCIQFSGKYGRFCDGFKNQFEKESSPDVIREKIKSYLIKQVNKLRTTTGRRRKAAADTTEKREPESGILSAPLKMLGELFDRAASLTGAVVSQASTAAEAARDTVKDVAASLPPVTIEVQSTTRAVEKRAARPAAKQTVKASKATPAKAKKATKRVAQRVGKQAKKAGKAARKRAGSAKKAKTTKKMSRSGK